MEVGAFHRGEGGDFQSDQVRRRGDETAFRGTSPPSILGELIRSFVHVNRGSTDTKKSGHDEQRDAELQAPASRCLPTGTESRHPGSVNRDRLHQREGGQEEHRDALLQAPASRCPRRRRGSLHPMHAREYSHARSVVPDHGWGLPRAMRPGGAFRVSTDRACVYG